MHIIMVMRNKISDEDSNGTFLLPEVHNCKQQYMPCMHFSDQNSMHATLTEKLAAGNGLARNNFKLAI